MCLKLAWGKRQPLRDTKSWNFKPLRDTTGTPTTLLEKNPPPPPHRQNIDFKLYITCFNSSCSCAWSIDLLGDIFLYCKWLNTRVRLVFIWSIHLIEIAVKSDENLLSMPYFFRNRISNLVLNFYRVYQRINKISEMNTRLIRASNVNSKEVYFFHNISEFKRRFRIFKFNSI